jgi:chemotaxis protein CheY-P-specific phosphatase CheC
VELTGGVSGYIIFVFPLSFIGDMIFAMMSYKPEAIGELELSALYETASIISGGICDQIAAEKGVVCDISAPFHSKRMPSSRPDETVALDTGMGIVEVDIAVSQK